MPASAFLAGFPGGFIGAQQALQNQQLNQLRINEALQQQKAQALLAQSLSGLGPLGGLGGLGGLPGGAPNPMVPPQFPTMAPGQSPAPAQAGVTSTPLPPLGGGAAGDGAALPTTPAPGGDTTGAGDGGGLGGLGGLPPLQLPSLGAPPARSPGFATGPGGGFASGLSASPTLPQLQRQVLGLEGNRDYAVGAAGELGPGQILPSTGAQYGYSPSQLYGDAGRAASGNIVADLYQKSGGDPAATLVGYNRGPGAMARFQAAGDDPSALKSPLAPAYKNAVIAHLSDEQRTQASDTALQAAGALPPQFVGRAGPGIFARLVERVAGSDADDVTKGAVLMQLLPLMSKEGQEQFTQTWDQYKFGVEESDRQRDFIIRQRDLQAQRQFNRDLALDRLDVSRSRLDLRSGIATGHVYQKPDGTYAQKTEDGGEINYGTSPPLGVGGGGGGGQDKPYQIQDKTGQPVGEPFMAHRTPSGQYVEAGSNRPIPLDTGAGQRIMPFKQDAARLQQQQQRMLGAANTAVFYLNNVSRLPITASRGAFMGVEAKTPEGLAEALKRTFARGFTSLETKEMQQSGAGLGRVFGMLETQGGIQGMQTYGQAIETALTPQAGDPPILTMRRMAEMRGIIERATQSGVAQTKDPKVIAFLEKIRAEAEKAVPYTMDQVMDLEESIRAKGLDPAKALGGGGADDSIREFAAKVLANQRGVAGGGGGTPTPPPQQAIDDLKQDPSPARQKQFDEAFGQGAAAKALGNAR